MSERPASARHPARPKPAGPELATELESLLREIGLIQRDMLALASEHRGAIAGADAGAIGACVERQRGLSERARIAEDRRRTLVASWAPRERGVTLGELARRVDEPARSRLLALGSHTRTLVERLSRENLVVRSATESLMAHMDGLVRQIARRLSESGTYGRRGPDAHAPLAAALDLRH